MKKYYSIRNKDDYADLLSVGFGFENKDPWSRFDVMYGKYGEHSAIDVSWSAKFITIGTVQHFLRVGYSPATLDDVVAIVKETHKSQ